jgi:hypothetical protein
MVKLGVDQHRLYTLTSSYRLKSERMQAEVLDYLLRPLSTKPEQQSV